MIELHAHSAQFVRTGSPAQAGEGITRWKLRPTDFPCKSNETWARFCRRAPSFYKTFSAVAAKKIDRGVPSAATVAG